MIERQAHVVVVEIAGREDFAQHHLLAMGVRQFDPLRAGAAQGVGVQAAAPKPTLSLVTTTATSAPLLRAMRAAPGTTCEPTSPLRASRNRMRAAETRSWPVTVTRSRTDGGR